MDINKRRMLMKAFVSSKFSYCPLIWMFHSRKMKHSVHKSALKLVYQDSHDLTFQELLAKDNSVSVDQKNLQFPEADLQGGAVGAFPPFFFRSHLFFYDHFEELQTGLTKVKLMINKAPLTYVYPNTIKTYLTPNRLLFGRQLCYSNTASTAFRNQTVLSSTTDKINHISNHFWHM